MRDEAALRGAGTRAMLGRSCSAMSPRTAMWAMMRFVPLLRRVTQFSQVLARSWEHCRVPSYLEKVSVRSAPIDVCFEDSLLPPLLLLVERAG